ncbi:PREDICTED: cyclic nucleotide-binding domain-containing protein 2-like [Nicrophorus vespilloides]|uniref:Cyclic nucleotide-binding domain-containing protein 2-like n=1 Tax=Nicrophorus vespilloides TaxID=110193 RepID=A0ABM1NKB0_NICVS|nr:PREDICTED: cyclic nucleotide-binding domain-containing protein 2-like [Nicrophorus vespilloides]
MVNEKVMMSAIRARRRFKAIVRLVIENLAWLEEIEPLGDNIRKNVKLVMRKHKTAKSLLTLREKALLNKPAEDRTDEEKLLLYRRIGGLKCFRKYPENVKMELAGVTYFAYFGPNRVIVREHHYAHALYFIISGEVIATTEIIDPVTYDKVINNMGTMITGQTFGEVSLLHNLPRNATITTLTPTEFLVLKRGDFDRVLKSTIQTMWDHIESIMDSFTYFNDWDDLTKKECCVIAKIKYYKKDDIIFGDGFGLKQWVYFIVTGKCQMIESLQVEVSYVDGKKMYKQYEPAETVSIKVEQQSMDKSVSVHSASKKSPQSSITNTVTTGVKKE